MNNITKLKWLSYIYAAFEKHKLPQPHVIFEEESETGDIEAWIGLRGYYASMEYDEDYKRYTVDTMHSDELNNLTIDGKNISYPDYHGTKNISTACNKVAKLFIALKHWRN